MPRLDDLATTALYCNSIEVSNEDNNNNNNNEGINDQESTSNLTSTQKIQKAFNLASFSASSQSEYHSNKFIDIKQSFEKTKIPSNNVTSVAKPPPIQLKSSVPSGSSEEEYLEKSEKFLFIKSPHLTLSQNKINFDITKNKNCQPSIKNDKNQTSVSDDEDDGDGNIQQNELVGIESLENGSNENKVESICFEGGEVFEEEASPGTGTSNESSSMFFSKVFILNKPNQQTINLKPILKRKSFSSEQSSDSASLPIIATLPLPILKKRDSLNEVSICSTQSSSTTFETSANSLANVYPQKPLSILKNRQARGSYSFDDSLNGTSETLLTSSVTTPETTSLQCQLKPILKKKSWSTEETINNSYSTNGSCTGSVISDQVRGILKPTNDNKSTTSSSTVSSKNSLADDSIAFTSSLGNVNNKSHTAFRDVALKSILKFSHKNRSSSLSPCTSFDSLVEDSLGVGDNNNSSKSQQKISIKNFLNKKRNSLNTVDDTELSSIQTLCQKFSDILVDNQNDTTIIDLQLQATTSSSVINNNIKPILKKNFLDDNNHNNDDDNNNHCSTLSNVDVAFLKNNHPNLKVDHLSLNIEKPISSSSSISSSSTKSTSFQRIMSSNSRKTFEDSTTEKNSPITNDYDDDDDEQKDFSKNETDERMMDSNVTLRKSHDQIKSRPKSCFVKCSESDEKFLGGVNSNSISQRLALLKQNGQEAWRNRLSKVDLEKEIKTTTSPSILSKPVSNEEEVKLRPKNVTPANSNIISNRLSSLLESQSQWRNRVPDNDAIKFTASSKLGQSNDLTPTSKESLVNKNRVLRETPKRLGFRNSTLNEQKLNSVSSKLNSILSPEKSFVGIPQKKDVPANISPGCISNSSVEASKTVFDKCDDKNEKIIDHSSSNIVNILKPDDEESFGSFYAIDDDHLNRIIEKKSDRMANFSSVSFDSIEISSPIKLLTHTKKNRIQTPKRRAASSRNPIKLLAETPIVVDSYQVVHQNLNSSSMNNGQSECSGKFSNLPDSKLATSALAGLASLEDFKLVASKLQSSSQNSSNSQKNNVLENSLQTRMLILVKGRRRAQKRLIEPNWRSLNQTDSFILVTKNDVFAYVGRFSNIIERTKCLETSELIVKRKELCYDPLSSKNNYTLIDGHDDIVYSNIFRKLLPLLNELDFSEKIDKKEFEKVFNQSIIELDEDDEFYEESINYSNLIYKVVESEKQADSALLSPLEQYRGRIPRHQVLQEELALVFDYGTEMYVWLGKSVSKTLRAKALEAAKQLWLNGYDYSEFDMNPFGENVEPKSNKRPEWSWFTKINQNMESILFKDKFFNWPAFTLTRSKKKNIKKAEENSNKTPNHNHRVVKKDLSQQLNLFPVNAENDMLEKTPEEPSFIMENVSLGRGAGDVIKDEDGLSVKVISLDMQCFYINDVGEKVKLDENDKNFLFNGESYYIRWKYRLTRISRNLKTGGESHFSEEHGGRDRLCYFVWQGKKAKNTQKGITALNAIEKLREEGAFQVYIEHGKENPVFLRIFQGSLVVQLGKRNQVKNNQNYRMFCLKDSLPKEEHFVELECSLKNLRSRTSYVFINPQQVSADIYIWHGIKSSEKQRQRIRLYVENKLLNSLSSEFGFSDSIRKTKFNIIEIEEGKEAKSFFNLLLSQTSSESTLKRSSKSNLQREVYFTLIDDSRSYNFTPRLFHFLTSSERIFEVNEIVPAYFASNFVMNYPFIQDDLYDRASSRPTFFLFDNNYEVFLWESKFPFFIFDQKPNCKVDNEKSDSSTKKLPGMIDINNEIQSECNTTTGFMNQLWLAERKCALETTLSYCHAKNKREPPKAYLISAGLEPDAFCGLFPTWTYHDNVAKIHIEDGRKPGEQILVQEVLAQLRDINQSNYSYEELKRKPLPEGINVLCLESYLDDNEFEKVFEMNREEFYNLPTWKQKAIKQKKELF